MINWPYPFDYESLRPCTQHNCPERRILRNRHHNDNLGKKRARHFMDDDDHLQPIDIFKDDLLAPELSGETDHLSKMSLGLCHRGKDQVTISDDKFLIKCPIEVRFTPEELTVRTLDDFIVLEGRHEDKTPNSHFSRSFFHKWSIPQGVQLCHMKCHLNPKTRELRLEAPRLLNLEDKGRDFEKLIPIKFQNKKQKTTDPDPETLFSGSEIEKILNKA